MTYVYNFIIFIFGILIKSAGIFQPKAKAFLQGRKAILKNIATTLDGNQAPVMWLHCASLGEFEQGRPIIEAFKSEFPSIKIFLTFFSPSGFEIRKTFPQVDYIFYLPLDTAKNAKRFVKTVQPVLAIFVKYEFWHHYMHQLRANNIPAISISSKFRKDQLFFRSYGKFYSDILRNFSHFFVQNSESVKLLSEIGIQNVTQSGDTRFDRVHRIVANNQPVPIVEKFKNKQKVFVVGSCWNEDLDVLIPFINERRLKFILAPHEVSESNVASIEKALQVKSIRFSLANEKPVEDYDVLIIDNVGMLSKLYRYGEFAYVGGAFGKGLHNILEAACYGVPIFFGNKNYEKFQEAVDLINRGGAFAIQDYPDLKAKYEMLNIPESFLLACEVTRQYVDENLGASEKIMQYCRKLLKQNTIL
jgi:3-deoxy-D-manno-octulosonic-acid transferase